MEIKKVSQGISLFEFMIYLALFSIIIGLSFQGAARVYSSFVHQNKLCSMLSNAYSACDLLTRDVHAASATLQDWNKIDGHEIIFKSKDMNIGWAFEHNALIRTVGNYDAKTHTWDKKIRRMAVASIHEMSFSVLTQLDRVMMVTVSCHIKNENDTHTITQGIVLRNGNTV
ncbi:MAG: hypothetical protein Q8Q25_03065 [bacterium]|nr:hypothetical protein [bacterium]